MTKEDYNNVPVEFCRRANCCSLAIVEEDGVTYCKECGGTKTEKAHINTWKEYYFMAHGNYLLDETIN